MSKLGLGYRAGKQVVRLDVVSDDCSRAQRDFRLGGCLMIYDAILVILVIPSRRYDSIRVNTCSISLSCEMSLLHRCLAHADGVPSIESGLTWEGCTAV